MAKFNVGRAVTTAVPKVLVDAGIPAGRHRFRLVVIDSAGNTSRPDEIVLTINRLGLPISPLVPPVPVVPVRPPRPPVTPPLIPPRRPRGRNRSEP